MQTKDNLKDFTFEKFINYKILFFFILLVGLFLRFYKFDIVPFGINHDSSAVALEAIDISQKPLPYRPFSKIDWKGETLILYLLAVPIKLFGYSASNIKLYSTIISYLLLPIFYLTVKKIFNRKIAILSLIFLSLSGWHIIMGKTAWPAILLPITECVFFYFFYRAISNKQYYDGAMAGISLALVMNSYSAAKFVPIFLIFIIFILYSDFKKLVNKRLMLLFVIFNISFLIFIAPLAFYIKDHMAQYSSRSSSMFVGNRIKEEGYFLAIKENIVQTLNMHLIRANGNDFFVNEPLIDPLSSFFFVIGLCLLLFFVKDIKYFFVLIGFFLSLIPGLLSVPNGNRDIGSLPFVYLIAGIGFYYLLMAINKVNRKIAIIVFFEVLAITFLITFNLYLGDRRRELFGFYPETSVVGNYMKTRMQKYDFYLTDNYPRDALTFLTYQGGNPYIKYYVWLERKEDFLNIKKRNKGLQFIMFDNPENRDFLPKLQSVFPMGRVSSLNYEDDNINRKAALLYIIN